ncbi:50S ribosomal protein L4 [Ureaplasma miroungigenitalium]|uniref:Large ribosomal subunit protein uL4 n=1 Tax=Ureaplasma miroungigenitalium TaxID=1042321 RepID=A0ABT3BMF6_9BACT|nr:50S ribosomal protein L4 [Ureaplasma miroungigenitalium]MCV3728411.1 50S ribosomal protein L4 [Ureaplasma miroungigenitalium]MCV3734198.1 50S ribosomal protein L4 [Ureaplasma miroungigenitalium]
MNKIKLLSVDGSLLDANFEVTADLFVEEVHKQAMFDVVLSENAAERQGTHSTLTKGEVRGGGKKPWRQKHTGKARTGSTRNPHWTGGGVVFGPKPNRNYAKKVNQKVRLLAFKSALTIKLNNQALYALDANAALEVPSTKKIVEFINTANFQDKKVLIALNDKNENIAKSSANLQKVIAKKWNQVSVRDVMHANVVVVAQDMLAKK